MKDESSTQKQTCSDPHEPLNYADFCARTTNRREWPGWPKRRMEIGECRICSTSFMCQVPDELPWYRPDSAGPQCCGNVAVRCRKCGFREECETEADIPDHCWACREAARPECYEDRAGLSSETALRLERIQAQTRRRALGFVEVSV